MTRRSDNEEEKRSRLRETLLWEITAVSGKIDPLFSEQRTKDVPLYGSILLLTAVNRPLGRS